MTRLIKGREAPIMVYCSPEERAAIKAEASRRGVAVYRFMLDAVLKEIRPAKVRK